MELRHLGDPSITRLSIASFTSRSKRKKLTKKVTFPLIVLVCPTLSFLFLAWIRIAQLQAGYVLSQLEKEELVLDGQIRALQLEVAVLKRPERIRRIGLEQLHLKVPLPNQSIHMVSPRDTL